LKKRVLAVLTALGLVATVVSAAFAGQTSRGVRPEKSKVIRDQITGAALASDDEDADLPRSRKNMKRIGKVQLTDLEGGLTDVAYLRGHAYVGAWVPNCPDGGGTHIVSLKNPTNPKKVAFAPTESGAYVSEGVHVFKANTDSFQGRILLQDRETCPDATEGHGGFDLYDVSNPKNPVALVLGAGDTDDNDPTTPEPSLPAPNDYHSIMGWQQGGKLYAVGVDNFEALDVDIFDISDPTAPVLIAETGLPDWPAATSEGFGNSNFHHDMWVTKIEGHWFLLVSYWDVGYTLLNIDDPAAPAFVEDHDYPATDPEFPAFTPPEGNAHQAEWSADKKFILAADEDFSPYRAQFEIVTGPNAGEYQAGEFGWTVPINSNFTDGNMNGPAVWGGRGCPPVADDPATPEDESFPGDPLPPDASTIPNDSPDEDPVLVLIRGLCFFSDKVRTAEEAGYKAVIIGNHHVGAEGGAAPDAFICGSQGSETLEIASAICVGHRAMHLIFDDEPEYDPNESPEGADMPAIGTIGNDVSATSVYDGWGYIQLFDADTLEYIDSYVTPVARTSRATDRGVFPLSVHEMESDPRKKVHLAYSAYYEAGARVLRFGRRGLREVGHFIPKGGTEYWGVQPVPRGKKRPLLLFSDRHYGLYVLKYTGRQ
jgi:hypothetical protein